MSIYLIRHGETAGNAERVMQVPETPLSPIGVTQAERLARRLAGEGITAILSSDLARAAMTAERLDAVLGVGVTFEPLLQERNFGDLRGRPYASFDEDPFAPGYVPPAGESWEDFHARVDAAWARVLLAAAAPGNLAVVTHGLVKHSVVGRKLGGDATVRGFPNTSVTIVEGPPWRLARLACVAHLDDTATGAPA